MFKLEIKLKYIFQYFYVYTIENLKSIQYIILKEKYII